MQIEVSDQKLNNFEAQMAASACYLEVDNCILLVQQGKEQTDEGLWGVPAGKLEPGETPEMAATRELLEETGIYAAAGIQIHYLGSLYIRKPNLDYIYYMFQVYLEQKPEIRLSAEHTDYCWANAEDLEYLPLRPGVKEALAYYRKSSLHLKNNQYGRSDE